MKTRWIAAIAVVALVGAITVYGQTDFGTDVTDTQMIVFQEGSVRFLNATDGSNYLETATDFSIYNDSLDLSLRLQTDRQSFSAGENAARLRSLIANAPTNWHGDQLNTHAELLANAKKRLEAADICIWPDEVMMVKTDGSAQFGAYYTTGSAIVIPSHQMKFLFIPPRRAEVEKTLAHEIWHIASRNNPELRSRAYAVFGFEAITGFSLPEKIRSRVIGNPDVEDLGYAISVATGERDTRFMIALRSAHASYGGYKSPLGLVQPLIGYMETVVYEVDDTGTVIGEGEILQAQLDEAIGTISSYRLGADEIVAAAVEALIDRAEGQGSYPKTQTNETLLDELHRQLRCGQWEKNIPKL